MSKILGVKAREVLDSRGFPTVEVDVSTESGAMGRAMVPSGASTGAHEAWELRDGDAKRFSGKGVLGAVAHVNGPIFETICDMDVQDWPDIEEKIIALDGTQNKKKLGANAILGTSLACVKAAALESKRPLYRFLGGVGLGQIPIPMMNVLNGGVHADNGLDVQEFMILPHLESFTRSLQAGSEVFHQLKKLLAQKSLTVAVGDEGGFAPKLKTNEQALDFLCIAIEKAGYTLGEDVFLALDVAATEFYKDGCYHWETSRKEASELTEVYESWLKKFPLISIEDGLAEDDWAGWSHLTRVMGSKIQLVGDDLFVTHPDRITKGIEKGCANALLVKMNQVGSLTETQKAVELTKAAGYQRVMSHRSGETEDTSIADLAVAMGCSQIKAGGLCRSERIAKYNRLLRIEEELGDQAQFAKLPFGGSH